MELQILGFALLPAGGHRGQPAGDAGARHRLAQGGRESLRSEEGDGRHGLESYGSNGCESIRPSAKERTCTSSSWNRSSPSISASSCAGSPPWARASPASASAHGRRSTRSCAAGWSATSRCARWCTSPRCSKRCERVQAKAWVDRMEATVEAHILPAAKVREAAGIPGTTVQTAFLCRDKPAMKEALRQADVSCAQSRGVSSPQELRMFAAEVGYPIILKPRAGAGASGTQRVDNDRELESAIVDQGLDRGASVAAEEFIEGHEGFYDTISIGGTRRARVHLALLPERPRGDAHALDLAPDRHDEPGRRAGLQRPAPDGPEGHRGAGHHHFADPHGVVLRPQGAQVLRDRLPPAGRRRLGSLRRGERLRHLSRVGDGRRPRPPRASRPRAATPPG